MRDDDDEYQRDAAPPIGSAAMADAFKIELQQELQKVELLWARKYGKDNSRAGSSRPAASYTMCYCCGNKGHYARDCAEAGSAKCNFCRKNGHLERACKQKKDRDESGAYGEASFFHGAAHCGFVELADCESTSKSSGEVLANVTVSMPQTFLADSGADHHICHDRSYFCKLSPLSGPFKVNQVQGSIDVTHSGSVMLEVDSSTGKKKLRLDNVLLIESMKFNIVSLQKLRATDFHYVFKEIPGKVVLKKELQNGDKEQVALFTETTSGHMTLDCKIPTLLTLPDLLPSCRQAEVFRDPFYQQTSSPAESVSVDTSTKIATADVPANPAQTPL